MSEFAHAVQAFRSALALAYGAGAGEAEAGFTRAVETDGLAAAARALLQGRPPFTLAEPHLRRAAAEAGLRAFALLLDTSVPDLDEPDVIEAAVTPTPSGSALLDEHPEEEADLMAEILALYEAADDVERLLAERADATAEARALGPEVARLERLQQERDDAEAEIARAVSRYVTNPEEVAADLMRRLEHGDDDGAEAIYHQLLELAALHEPAAAAP